MATKPKDSRKKRSDGEGSVYRQHLKSCSPADPDNGERPKHSCEGRWLGGALVLGYRDGKPVRRKVSANTKSGAATKLRELRDKYDGERLPAGKSPTVKQWLNVWLKQIAPRKVRRSTLDNSYTTKVESYIIPLLGHHKLDQLQPEHIEAPWDHLSKVGNPTLAAPTPLSPSTVLQTHRILARALKVAGQRGLLRRNPASSDSMDAPSGSTKEMTPLTLEETKRVLTNAEGTRLAARWNVALALGLRQGEALGLPWSNVDLEDGVVRVRQAISRVKGEGLVLGGLKSSASRRDIALPPALLAKLKEHRKSQKEERLAAGSHWQDHGLVFTQMDGRPIDPARDWKSWHDLLAAAEVPHRRLHDARHSAATLMLLQESPRGS